MPPPTRWHNGKESAYQCRRCRRPGFNCWVRKISWRSKWQPTPVFCLENPMDRGAWQAIVYGVAKSLTQLKQLSMDIYSHDHGNMLPLNSMIQTSLLKNKNAVVNYKCRNMIIFIPESSYFQRPIALETHKEILKMLNKPKSQIL